MTAELDKIKNELFIHPFLSKSPHDKQGTGFNLLKHSEMASLPVNSFTITDISSQAIIDPFKPNRKNPAFPKITGRNFQGMEENCDEEKFLHSIKKPIPQFEKRKSKDVKKTIKSSTPSKGRFHNLKSANPRK